MFSDNKSRDCRSVRQRFDRFSRIPSIVWKASNLCSAECAMRGARRGCTDDTINHRSKRTRSDPSRGHNWTIWYLIQRLRKDVWSEWGQLVRHGIERCAEDGKQELFSLLRVLTVMWHVWWCYVCEKERTESFKTDRSAVRVEMRILFY